MGQLVEFPLASGGAVLVLTPGDREVSPDRPVGVQRG
jgi:hypothetical protein